MAQGFVMPNTSSFDPNFRSEMGTFDRARAIALLDMYGYIDKDGDGWRDLPDGKPLVLEYDTLGTADYRERDEIVKKNLDAIGIKIELPDRQVARTAARVARRQADDVGLRLFGQQPNSGGVLQLGYSKSRSASRTTRASRTRSSTSCTTSRA